LATRILADYEQQRVTVVKLKDEAEYRKMMNNLAPRLREAGFKARPMIVEQQGEIRAFMELALREEKAAAPLSADGLVASGVG